MVLYGSNGLLGPWVQSIVSQNLFGSCFYQWINETRRFQSKNQERVRIFAIRLFLGAIYGILITTQVLVKFKALSKAVISHSILFLTAYIQGWICCYVDFTNPNEVISLTNRLIEYDEKQMNAVNQVSKDKLRLEKGLIKLQIASGISLPILYHIDVFRNPCYPVYFGYWLSNQCQTTELGNADGNKWVAGEIAAVLGIISVSYFNWSIVYTGYCYDVTLQTVIYGQCIVSFISHIGRNMMKATNQSLEKMTRKFREIQLMLIHYRSLYSKIMLSAYIFCFTSIEVLCAYNTISTVREGTFMNSTMNFLYAWSSILLLCNVMFCFGALAGVYQVSREVQGRLERKIELRRNKWFKRWLRSCPLLRIYFGGTNYLVEQTPLNILVFVINNTVSLLLLK